MGLRATVMKDNEKLIKLVHEQELQIATLLHEVSFYREKCVAFGLQKFEAEVESQWTKKEVARLGGVVMDLESKLALTPAQRIVADTKEAIDKILKNE